MKFEPRIGLIGAGGLRRSHLTELPSLQAQLGPIKAASFSVAKKYAKSLRAGYPVQPYSALELCPVIWVAVPPARLRETVEDLVNSTALAGTEIIICGADADSLSFPQLLRSGALVATVNVLDPRDHSIGYVAEGHPAPLKRLRQWFRKDRLRLLEVRQGAKSHLLAGRQLAGAVLRSVAAAALEYLRSAGMKPRDAAELVQQLGATSVQAASHPASGSANLGALKRAEQEVQVLMDGHTTRLDSFYSDVLAAAIRYSSGSHPGKAKGPRPPGQESAAGANALVTALGKAR